LSGTEGIDISLDACERFFKENQIPYKQTKKGKFHILKSEKITLLVGDFFDLDKSILGRIDAIYDRAALIALPLPTQKRYAEKMISLLDLNTQMMLMTCEYDPKEIQGPPFPVPQKEVRALFGKRFAISLLYEGPVEDIPAHLQAKGLKHLEEAVFYLAPTL